MIRPTRDGPAAALGGRQPRPLAARTMQRVRAAGGGGTLPDVLAPGLSVVFCGINPGLYSAATGQHFARPGNRFWPALHRGGFTPRQLPPVEQSDLLGYGLGITNLVDRATARADELSADELRTGAAALATKERRLRPAWVAVLGVTAYRTAFERPQATVGPQPAPLGSASVWVLPNPSGLNAHYNLDALAAEFSRLRAAVTVPRPRQPIATDGSVSGSGPGTA